MGLGPTQPFATTLREQANGSFRQSAKPEECVGALVGFPKPLCIQVVEFLRMKDLAQCLVHHEAKVSVTALECKCYRRVRELTLQDDQFICSMDRASPRLVR